MTDLPSYEDVAEIRTITEAFIRLQADFMEVWSQLPPLEQMQEALGTMQSIIKTYEQFQEAWRSLPLPKEDGE